MEIAKVVVNQTSGCCTTRARIPAGIVGAKVSVSFSDPIWEGLQKTVVFRGAESRIAEFDGTTAIVPAEAVAKAGETLFFGIWGFDAQRELQLPLIEVRIGIVEESTNPNHDPDTDPSLPVWAQTQAMIGNLENLNTTAKENLVVAINETARGGAAIELVESFTLEESTSSIVRNQRPDGTSYGFKTIFVLLRVKNALANKWIKFIATYDRNLYSHPGNAYATVLDGFQYYTVAEGRTVDIHMGVQEINGVVMHTMSNASSNPGYHAYPTTVNSALRYNLDFAQIIRMEITSEVPIAAGTEVLIYGVSV